MPEKTYKKNYKDIEKQIIADGYVPKTSMKNLIKMIVAHFDNNDNYGKYSAETGCGGYGDEFSLEGCLKYINESGGYAEFDYYL